MTRPTQIRIFKPSIKSRFGGIAVAALFASTAVTLTPRTASAFDVSGLIGAAIAAHMGGIHSRGPSHHGTREHIASRHQHDDGDTSNPNTERDARDAEPPPAAKGSKVAATHTPSGTGGISSQASTPENDATAGQPTASSKMVADDAPTFSPSR